MNLNLGNTKQPQMVKINVDLDFQTSQHIKKNSRNIRIFLHGLI
jgi:hypothetical protein